MLLFLFDNESIRCMWMRCLTVGVASLHIHIYYKYLCMRAQYCLDTHRQIDEKRARDKANKLLASLNFENRLQCVPLLVL